MSLRTIILSWLLFLTSLTIAQDYQHFFNEGKKAFAEKQYTDFYAQMKKAHELHPYHQTILWYAGVAAALTDHSALVSCCLQFFHQFFGDVLAQL